MNFYYKRNIQQCTEREDLLFLIINLNVIKQIMSVGLKIEYISASFRSLVDRTAHQYSRILTAQTHDVTIHIECRRHVRWFEN